MILCPACGKIADWSMYFQEYRCTKCNWHGSLPIEVDTKEANRILRDEPLNLMKIPSL